MSPIKAKQIKFMAWRQYIAKQIKSNAYLGLNLKFALSRFKNFINWICSLSKLVYKHIKDSIFTNQNDESRDPFLLTINQ